MIGFDEYAAQILKRDSDFAQAHAELCKIISEFSDAIGELTGVSGDLAFLV